jgi:hypothetical protein
MIGVSTPEEHSTGAAADREVLPDHRRPELRYKPSKRPPGDESAGPAEGLSDPAMDELPLPVFSSCRGCFQHLPGAFFFRKASALPT